MAAADQPRDDQGRFIREADAGIAGLDRLASQARSALTAITALHTGANALGGGLGGIAAKALAANGALGTMVPVLGAVTLALAALTAIAGTISFGITLAAQAEQTQVAFATMLGSAEDAKALLGDIRSFAIDTPFREEELISAGRALVAFGEESRDVVTVMRRIGDVSSGISQPIGEIAEIYGKARVQGRLFATDINQLTNRGIPVIQELAKQFGTTDSEVKKLVESGQVEFAHLEEAFRSLTSEGGQFYNLTANQSQTLLGKWSTFQDSFVGSLRKIGEQFLATGVAQEALDQASRAVTAGFAIFQRIIGATGGDLRTLADRVLALTDKVVQLAEWMGGIEEPTNKASAAIEQQEIRATAATAALAAQAKAADQLAQMQTRYATASEKLRAELEAIANLQGNSHQLMELRDRAREQATGLGAATQQLRDEIDVLTGLQDSLSIKSRDYLNKGATDGEVATFIRLEEEKAELLAAQKAREENIKKLAESYKKSWDAQAKIMDRGKDLTESLRTPIEEYKAGLKEVRELWKAGAIDLETLKRRDKQLTESLLSNAPEAPEYQQNVAVDSRSEEAITLILAATSNRQSRQETLLQELKSEAAKSNGLLDKIAVDVFERIVSPTVFKVF